MKEKADCFAIITVTINVLWLFLTVPWVGLQCVILVFPDHIQLLFPTNFPTFFAFMGVG